MENQDDSIQSDWRKMSSSLLDKLKYVLMNGLLTDLTIRLINGENITEYKVHKLVFQLASEVFDRMLNSSFKEGLSSIIEIKDVEPDTFQLFLNYLYGQPLIITNTEMAIDLYKLADCYLIHSLKEDIFKTTETPDLACIGLELAEKYEAPMLREAQLEYISKNAKQVVKSTNFLKASLETVKTIMEQDKLSIWEIDLFEAVRVWIQHNLAEKGESIKETLMPKFRYTSMSPKEFVDGPMASKLLNYDDVFHLLSYLLKENSSVRMPAGFSEAKRIYTNQLTTESLSSVERLFQKSYIYVTTDKSVVLTHIFIYPSLLIGEEKYEGNITIKEHNGISLAYYYNKEMVNVVDKIEIQLIHKLRLNKNKQHCIIIETSRRAPRKLVNLSNQTIHHKKISFKFENFENYDPCLPIHSFLFEC